MSLVTSLEAELADIMAQIAGRNYQRIRVFVIFRGNTEDAFGVVDYLTREIAAAKAQLGIVVPVEPKPEGLSFQTEDSAINYWNGLSDAVKKTFGTLADFLKQVTIETRLQYYQVTTPIRAIEITDPNDPRVGETIPKIRHTFPAIPLSDEQVKLLRSLGYDVIISSRNVATGTFEEVESDRIAFDEIERRIIEENGSSDRIIAFIKGIDVLKDIVAGDIDRIQVIRPRSR